MKKTKKQSRRLALALCLCMLASVFPHSGIIYAAETGCNHKHDTAVCGYIEAAQGAPCAFAHEHDESCGYSEAKESAPCSVEAAHTVHDASCGGPDTGEGCAFTHKHDDACGYAEAKEAAPCSIEAAHTVHETAVCGPDTGEGCAFTHKHDESCGYAEAKEAAPCSAEAAHTAHDASCGGPDTGEGCAFTHKHDGACGYAEAKEAAPCSVEAAHTAHDASCGGPDTGEGCAFTHKHDDACGYAEAKEVVPCAVEAAHTVHETAVCGYKGAVAGAPCNHSHDESCGGLQARAGGQSIAALALPGASQSGAGYVFVLNTGTLTITTNEGTTAWREAISPPQVNFVEIGDQVTAIGDNAFWGVAATKVVIPAGVEHIGEGAFAAEDIKTIQVEPENQHFVSVDNVLYSKKMDTLYAYPSHKAGDAFTIPDSVERIGNWAFRLCYNLESVKFPAGLKSIGDNAFFYGQILKSVDLSGCADLTSIGDSAFEECGRITSVKLPTGLKSIGKRAFWNNGFQSVDISAGVEHIGEGALSSYGLESINLDPGNRHFITEEGVLYNTAKDTLYCYPAKKAGDAFTIPESVERIGDSAFQSCRSLTSVTFPAGLKSMGDDAFSGSSLKSADLSGCAGMTAIEDNVFASCWWLTSVALPAGLKSIGEGAFGYSGLQSVDLSGCASLESIGDSAFEECKSLQRVTFPAGLKSIGQTAFGRCNEITTFRFTGDVPPKLGLRGEIASLKWIYYPAGAQGYTDLFSGMTFIEIYRLTVNRGVDETGGGLYDPGARVTIAADTGPGKTFAGWRGGSDSVFAAGSREEIRTTIIMPAEHLTLTVAYAEDEIKHSHSYGGWQHDDASHWHACSCGDIADKAAHDFGGWVTDKKPTEATSGSRHRDCNTCGYRQTGSIAPVGPDYAYRTLTDEASSIQVSGLFTASAALAVKEVSLHAEGGCDVCDDIRERQKNGELIVLFDIALKSGKYTGELEVEIPVGEQYNGQTAIMLHCKDKVPESRTVTVENGIAKGTFSGLSPYAVAKVPGKTVITGLPESDTLLVGRTVSWTPAPAGGEWRYDKSLLEMTKDGDTYTFKALKEGKATATYTVDGVPHTVTITVTDKSSTIPQTDDMSNLWLWMLPALAALLGCGGLLVYKKRSKRV